MASTESNRRELRIDGNEKKKSVPRHGNVTKGVNLHQITQRLDIRLKSNTN